MNIPNDRSRLDIAYCKPKEFDIPKDVGYAVKNKYDLYIAGGEKSSFKAQ